MASVLEGIFGSKVVAKTIIIFDVKVYEEGEDFKRLHGEIMKIELDGLVWNKDLKLVEIAFGMKKL